MPVTLQPGKLDLATIRQAAEGSIEILLDPQCDAAIVRAFETVQRVLMKDEPFTGSILDSGFWPIPASRRINFDSCNGT